MDWQAQLIVVATTAFAMALGGVIGYERELKNRPAGFRTHMLVAGASGLLLGIGLLTLQDPSMPHSESIKADPLRLLEAVVAGVSFIGGGTIFAARGRDTVAGITTAASLLMVAVVGAAAGLRYFWLALGATALTLLVLSTVNVLERRFGMGGRKPDDKPD